MKEDRLLTVTQAAQMLSVHRNTVYRLRAKGELHFVYVTGRAPRVKLSEVQRIISHV